MNYISIKNNQRIPLSSIPLLEYTAFLETNAVELMREKQNHCVNFYGIPYRNKIKLLCCMADDNAHLVYVSSCIVDKDQEYPSFTAHHLAFEKFEREIHENFGIRYNDHPWLKPVRYAFNRADKSQTIANYPFFSIDSEELHEVGVGPIHAGIIEPGHFRFICNGEQILHLEIQLGYQHRGIENLFLQKDKLLQRVTLAESIAGDNVAGHTTAFINLWEGLCGYEAGADLQFTRTLALELERVAVHTGDLSGMCTDIAYQLGSSVFGRLRTPIINFFQIWGGNRLAKGLLRPGRNKFPFTAELAGQLIKTLDAFEPDFIEMCNELFNMPSALSRFEKTGVISFEQASEMGTVGMSARMSGITRDIRLSHPHDGYTGIDHTPIVKHHGDVYSRANIRRQEVLQSIGYIRKLFQNIPQQGSQANEIKDPYTDSFALSLVEGWRGEICHCAITGSAGELVHYKVKDPSMHNWLALAQAVRNNEISDFPISNKSFDFSYCGHDL
jgi:Ni,Fe-hydrogenase III large subunit